MTKTANHARKVRALLVKTTANGCEPAEAVSALMTASAIVAKHGLNTNDFIWPEPPTGYRWEGKRGHGGTVVEVPAPRPKRTNAKSAEPKQPRRTKKEIIVAMLRQPGGTTIDAITALFGTKPHSARAAISVYGREIGGVIYDPTTKAYCAKA